MTIRYDLPPSHADPPPTQAACAMPPPWMPLDAVLDCWAVFGKATHGSEALRATSAAFVALAEEREALHMANRLADLHGGPLSALGNEPPFLGQQPVIELLTQAATHWYEAAYLLWQMRPIPHSTEDDPLPPGCDLDTLLGSTLAQRERVWAIAHALLGEHARPSRDRLTEGMTPWPADHPQDEVQP